MSKNSFVKGPMVGGPVANQSGSGPAGTWVFLEKGQTNVPNGSGDLTVSTPYTPALNEMVVAFVCMDGATAIRIMNDNTNINPGISDVHWNLVSSAGAITLHLRSGNSGGSVVNWAIYSFFAP